MTKKGITAGVLGLVALGAVAIVASAYAYQGDPTKFGPNYTPERHEAMQTAFEKNDYAAWKAQMGNRGAANKVTEQNFARFAEMRNLMLEGKTTDADAIRAELGLGQGGRNGQGGGMHAGQRGQNQGGNFVDANNDGTCDRMQ